MMHELRRKNPGQSHVIGFAYFAPAAMTDRTWYLYWIAVAKKTQAKGTGAALLHYTEEEIRKLREEHDEESSAAHREQEDHRQGKVRVALERERDRRDEADRPQDHHHRE